MSTTCSTKQQTAIDEWIESINFDDPYVNSVYYDKIGPLFKQYQNTITGDFQRERDDKALIAITGEINSFLTNEASVNRNFSSLYPDLFGRLTATTSTVQSTTSSTTQTSTSSTTQTTAITPVTSFIITTSFITPAEVSTVINASFLTFDTVGPYLTPYNPTIPTLFNEYYSPGSFSKSGMRSFCDLVPNIFAAYADFMNAFSDIKAFAQRFNNILSAIQDFSLAGLLDNLKKQALSVIDSIVAKVRAKLDAIKSLINRAANYSVDVNNIYSKAIEEKAKVESVTSDDPIDKLKAAIDGAISFASSLFEELKIEEIQFLILRFCELISGIENFFDGLLKPLEEIPNNFRKSFDFLQAAGFNSTSRAVASGAFRIPSSERTVAAAQINNLPSSYSQGAVGAPTGQGFGDESTNIDGGIAVRARRFKISPITDQEWAEVSSDMTFERVKGNASKYVYLVTNNTSYNIDGRKIWDNVRPLEKVMLYRLCKLLNTKLTVTSAWRSQKTQSVVNPSVPSSWHCSGQAFDIVKSSFNTSQNQFTLIANSIGFGFIKDYPSKGFVHISAGG